ncbi:MAG: type II toxin-antitoxin system VapC family toxin [Dehalococcoidia bacterium]|nr:type II toxin-antitoxin system VapC family toxin [Dehalococcoidia bacterium]
MSAIVIDTNIISFYLREDRHVIDNIEKALIAGDELIIAPIAYYEIRRGLVAVNSVKRLIKFEHLCEVFPVGKLDNAILDIAADIYVELKGKGSLINDADILIAAFCKQHGFTLVTNNIKHFESISGLPLLNWAQS